MEEKRNEKGGRSSGKATAESCGLAIAGGPAKRRMEDRTERSESEVRSSEEFGGDGPSSGGWKAFSARLERIESALLKWEKSDGAAEQPSVARKHGSTADGMSCGNM